MINRNKARRVLWYEAFGFLCLITLSWLNELIALPHLLFGGGTGASWHEAAMETVALLMVWLLVWSFTRRILNKVYQLEGFLHVCAWCRKIGHEEDWQTIEQYFAKGFDIKTSHGMCPDCSRKWEREVKLKAAA